MNGSRAGITSRIGSLSRRVRRTGSSGEQSLSSWSCSLARLPGSIGSSWEGFDVKRKRRPPDRWG